MKSFGYCLHNQYKFYKVHRVHSWCLSACTLLVQDVAIELLVGHRTCDSHVAGLSPGWAPLCSCFGQTTYMCVYLSPSSIIWYQPSGWSLWLRN